MQVKGDCLGKSGSEAAHVGDVGLLTAAVRVILEDVAANDLVVVSADTDFGEMLGFADTIFGQTPGICRATLGRHGLPAVARGRVG
jgi:predicted nuclease of predicted toxin-antitoxin system